ncbi:MAG TPA: TonB-dependent receptor, partial [Chitinophaga sp.]
TSEGELSFFDSSNIYHPVFGQTPNEPVPDTYLPFVSLISRVGFYAQDQLMFFNEKLHLLAGIRAGRTRQGNHYFQDKLAGTAYEGYQDDIVSKNVITPRVGLVYKPQTNLSLYASWSKGYEINSPDVFAQNYAAFSNPPPTYSTQWEAGAKASLLQSRLGASFTLFRIDKRDPYGYTYIEDADGNIDYDKYNVYYQGHHRSEGIELDIDGKISNTLSVTAGAAYTDTRVVEDPGYPAGNQLPNAPRYTGNVWLNYDPAGRLKGLSLGAGFFYKGKFFSSITNDPGLIVPSNYTIDIAAGYTYKQFGAQLNVTNLTNRISYLNPWAFLMYDVQPLRRAVLTLSYHFVKTPKKK